MSEEVSVAVLMGSQSDWDVMRFSVATLDEFDVSCEARVISAHRTPEEVFDFADSAHGRGVKIIIAGAGGAAHLPGMLAAKTVLPVLGVPISSSPLQGVDSLYSIVQMPSGAPVATFSIGKSGAINAALFAVSILSLNSDKLRLGLLDFRERQRQSVIDNSNPVVI
ncbi:5-(carboxyamino)imidazole ribonucleotide mutase [Candidatus Ichthyocystis hellenicum]|uniref:5-(carboxyamino)imidazole ribonucleotide mutase n=1 Tax=Candidatus Ichthyocystis hellenicum TaxID=1561003 RepID=UPI000AE153AE|nr:5-(carboxyamino)imidazole ribonucleotide mutase [Candidatus Ichthyocystis hellenicum]